MANDHSASLYLRVKSMMASVTSGIKQMAFATKPGGGGGSQISEAYLVK